MSKKAKQEYLEHCRKRYPHRGRRGKSILIDEVSEAFGWSRKHAIKALNGKVSLGKSSKKRGAKATWGDEEQKIITRIWERSEQPCGVRLQSTLPLWITSYEARYGELSKDLRKKILGYSARTLDRILAPHRAQVTRRYGRKSGRTSHRLKNQIPIRCGAQNFDEPGWMEVDTVSHGGGSSSGEFLWTLTMTDFYSGWTELGALWGCRGGEVLAGVRRIEDHLPFSMLGFDCDNGSEFLNEVLEGYLLGKDRRIAWTRSRAYKKNDQAHVEQKNYTHVRQLLGYGRFDDLTLKAMVEELYREAWLPLRNYFTPAMKLSEKVRIGSKVRRKYDCPSTPCDRLLGCPKVSSTLKKKLRLCRSKYDPISLSDDIERRLKEIFTFVEKQEHERQILYELMEGELPEGSAFAGACATPSVAKAPYVSAQTPANKNIDKEAFEPTISNKCLVS